MTLILAIAALGALMNRIRGGMFRLPGKALNAVVFGLLMLAIVPWWQAGLAAAAMAAGAAPGWGKYIGALGGWEQSYLTEWPPIDRMIFGLTEWPRLWGFAGLTLRGLFWGALLGASLRSVWPVLAGASCGVCFRLALTVLPGRGNKGWELGEALFGAVLWGGCAVC